MDAFEKSVEDLDGDGVFEPGDRVRYTLVVRNDGTEPATNAVVSDPIDPSLQHVTALDGGVVGGGSISWSSPGNGALASVGVGESVTLRFEADIARPLADATVVQNQATLSGANFVDVLSDDPATPALVDDPTLFTVVSNPLLVLEKSVVDTNGIPVEPGDTLSWTIRVRNVGGRSAVDVRVDDVVDANLVNVVPLDGGVLGGGAISWSSGGNGALAAIAVDDEVVLRFDSEVVLPLDNGTIIANQASGDVAEPGVPGAPFLSDDPLTPAPLDPTTVQVVSASDLSASTLESFDDGGLVIDERRPGEPVFYTLVVRNAGRQSAQNVVVTLPIPAELQVESAPGGTVTPGQVTFDGAGNAALQSVRPGDEVTLVIETRVVFPLDDGTLVDVQASLDEDGLVAPVVSDDPSTPVFGDLTQVRVNAAPNLDDLAKAFVDTNGAPVEPGETIDYIISVTNTGDAHARNIVVTDPLPSDTTFVSSVDGGQLVGGSVVFDSSTTPALSALAPGTALLRFTVQVNAGIASGTFVSNQATALADGLAAVLSDDVDTPAPDDATVFEVIAVPRVELSKELTTTTGTRIVAPEEPLSYTFTVRSSGTATTQPSTLTDTLPAGLDQVVPGAGLVYDAGTRQLTAAVSALAPDEQVVFTLQARVAPGTPNGTRLENQAEVQGADVGTVLSDDPTTPALADATVALVEAFPELTTSTKVAEDLDGAPLTPGDVVRYTLTVNNTGNGAARDVVVVDDVDGANLEILTALDGGLVTGDRIQWDGSTTPALASLPAGGQVALRFEARVRPSTLDGTVIANQGQVNATDLPAPVLTDDPGTAVVGDATVVVVRAPQLVFEKRFNDLTGGPELAPGDEVLYELVIRNAGSGPATDVVVTDLVPTELVDVAPEDGGVLAAGTVTWNAAGNAALASIDNTASITLRLRGRVDPLATGGTVVANQGFLVATELAEPLQSDDPATDEAGDPTRRLVEADELFTGTVELFDAETDAPIVAPVVPDQRVRARITFLNEGQQTGQGAVLRVPYDPLRFVLEEATDFGIVDAQAKEARWDASLNDTFRAFAPGEGLTVEVVGRVASPIPDGATIDVRGLLDTLTSPETFVFGPATMTVRSRPSLDASTKEVVDDNGGQVEPGDVLTYRITVINDGGAEATGVVLTDPVPAGTVYVPGSTTVAGVPMGDVASGLRFGTGDALGDVGAGRSVVVSFQVRVGLDVVRGMHVSNQAVLSADGVPDAVTDNPTTPLVLGDPTVVVVGGGPALVATKLGAPSPVGEGEVLRFDVAVENAGNDLAENVVLRDLIQAPAIYQENSVLLDGSPVTDAEDGDGVTVRGGAQPEIEVRRDVLEAGEGFLLSFEVLAGEGTSIRNQADVTADRLAPVLTDADPTLPGAQSTVVPIAGGGELLVDGDAIVLEDIDGGLLLPGDGVAARTVVRNSSEDAVQVQSLTFNVSALLDVVPVDPDTGLVWDAATRTVRLADDADIVVEPGETHTFRFFGSVNEQAVDGDPIRAVADGVVVSTDGGDALAVDLGEAQLTVGLLAGTGALAGTAFFESGRRNGVFDIDDDERAVGFQVLARSALRPDDDPVRTAVTDEDGLYRLLPLPAGDWIVELRSPSGAFFAEHRIEGLEDGELRDEDLLIDPSGAVYNSASFDSVRGARATLYYDDGDGELDNDVPVPAGEMRPGQQGQLTTLQGLYRFDAPAGEYRIGLEPPQGFLVFPSSRIEPDRDGDGGHPLGSVARPAEDGTVVAHALPDAALDSTYFLRFRLAEDLPPVLNNHIPLDRLQDRLRITKTASRKRVSIGDLIAYTVRVENRSDAEIDLAEGGVEVVDSLPEAFRLVDDSWRVDRIETDDVGQQRRVPETGVGVEGKRVLRFGPFALQPRAAYEVRYQVVVGPGAPRGDADNRAVMRAAQGQIVVSDEAVARVKVVADPLFDLGSIRAKVFCDDDEDGWQDPGELGVPGARVYLDTGHYADADVTGKLHFSLVPPGMHLAKLDTATLPPRTRLHGDERKSVYLSAGLPAQISFGARCIFDVIKPNEVVVNEDAYRGDEVAPAGGRSVVVEGMMQQRRIRLDGIEMSAPQVDLGVALEGDDPVFAPGPGPNVPRLGTGGVLDQRLVFVPRVAAARRILAWQLTVQREDAAPAAPAPVSAAPPPAVVEAAAPDAGPEPGDAGVATPDGGAAADAGVPSSPALAAAPSADVTAEPVYVFAGTGAPPARIEWDGRRLETGTLLLDEGARYGAVLSVTVDGGDEGYSATRPFGVVWQAPGAEGEVAPAVETSAEALAVSLDASEGDLFGADDEPSGRLRRWLRSHVPQLGDAGSVELRVHVDARPGEATQALTARRAQAAARDLEAAGIAAGRISAMGEGDTKPVRPNLRARDRKKNRRVELRLVPDVVRLPSVPPRSWPASLRVAGEAVALDVGGPLVTSEHEVALGSALVVDLVAPGGGRVRIHRVVREGPFAPAGEVAPEEASVARISGSLAEQRLVLDGRELPLDLLSVDVGAESWIDDTTIHLPLAVAGKEREVVLLPLVGAERDWIRWRLRIMEAAEVAPEAEAAPEAAPVAEAAPEAETGDAGAAPVVSASPAPADSDAGPAGDAGEATPAPAPATKRPPPRRTVRELSGDGRAPAQVLWDGRDGDGLPVLHEGSRFEIRLILEAASGDVAISADRPARVSTGPALGAPTTRGAEERHALGDVATRKGALKRAARARIAELASSLGERPGSVRVEAHTDDRGTKLAQRARTQRAADAVKARLAAAGVDETRVVALGHGSDKPLVPNLNARSRAKNRRVDVVFVPEVAGDPRPAAVVSPRVLANGQELPVSDGAFSGEVPASTSGEVAIMVRDERGARAMVRTRPGSGEMWQGPPDELGAWVAQTLAATTPEPAPAPIPTAEGDAGAAPSADAASPDVDGGTSAAPALVATATPDGGAPDAGAAEAVALAPYSGPEQVAPAWWPTLDRVAAADLEVQLPPEGEIIKSRQLAVRGRTRPGNVVRVNQVEVPVDAEDGTFAYVVELSEGDAQLVVEAEDPVGNKARVRRAVSVDSTGWFVLALADTALGGDGARLAERTPYTSASLGDFFLYGRGVAYVKGRFTGDTVFRDYDLTLHLDTSRWAEESWARDLKNPDLTFPTFGDSSLEVQEAQARFPLYMKLQADASSLLVGSVRPGLSGGDLFRYDRARYGAKLSFDRGWATGLEVAEPGAPMPAPASDEWRTRADVFFTGGDTRERHARVEMQGTGGSVYFLRHEWVKEGSERIALIVRDGITGAEIARRPLARNIDYTMRYAQGRLLMMEPVPAFTDASFSANHNLGQVRSGHRVFVEVEYDHADEEPFAGLAGGGHAKQTLFGHLELGGGYVYEAREDGEPGYQLGGVHAKLFYDDLTFLKAEWAMSQNVDAGNFISLDGGLTYNNLGQSLDEQPTRIGRVVFPTDRQGQAYKLEGQLGFGQWVGRSAADGLVRTYFQRQTPGFFAGSSIVEQGQTKWGLDGAWRITDDDLVRLRYDGVLADIPEVPHVSEMRTLNRQLVTAQYERRILKGLRGGVEYGYGFTGDSGSFGETTFAQPREVHTNVMALKVDWQAMDRLALGLKQEVLLSGDPNQLVSWSDHLITHATARYNLTDDIALTGAASLRWSGENQVSGGVRWQVNEKAAVYANERFGFAPGGFTNTTVVGGETEIAEGSKAYGEYHLQSAFAQEQSKAVLGLNNRWKLPFGFVLSLGYERVQTLGGVVPPTETGNVPPGAFTDGTFYATPGANGGGNFFYGAMSRDAASVGVEYARPGFALANTRLEVRYDNFEESRGGHDRIWLLSMNNAEMRVSPELALLARYNIGLAQDITFARREAYLEEAILGAAYRPVTHDWVSVLSKLSRKVDARPISLLEGRMEDYTIHAASIEPIVELPWQLQLVEKLALKHTSQAIDDLPRADALTVLWINRINWHALGTFRALDIDPYIPGEIDFGIEYRMLAGLTAARFEHGFLFETQYAPVSYFRVGLGYNFTHFSDDELARDDRDYAKGGARAKVRAPAPEPPPCTSST
jgi:uncharacterized repeat protein (TIGR01451 family)